MPLLLQCILTESPSLPPGPEAITPSPVRKIDVTGEKRQKNGGTKKTRGRDFSRPYIDPL